MAAHSRDLHCFNFCMPCDTPMEGNSPTQSQQLHCADKSVCEGHSYNHPTKWPPGMHTSRAPCPVQTFPTLNQDWLMQPMEYGKSEGMWLSGLHHKAVAAFMLAPLIAYFGEADPHAMRTSEWPCRQSPRSTTLLAAWSAALEMSPPAPVEPSDGAAPADT